MQRARQERAQLLAQNRRLQSSKNSTIGYPYDTHAADLCSGDRP